VPRSKATPVDAAAPPAQRTGMKVLIAVDGSVYTKRMLDFLVRNFAIIKEPPEFTVLHAVAEVSAHALAVLDRPMLQRYYDDTAAGVFRPVRRRLQKLGVKAEFVYRVGSPAEVISSTAESGGFDVVMMGRQGSHALSRLLLGSVVTRVMAECKVPVLLVP
jgi:nucleotide-binding universal stress UspA family protein